MPLFAAITVRFNTSPSRIKGKPGSVMLRTANAHRSRKDATSRMLPNVPRPGTNWSAIPPRARSTDRIGIDGMRPIRPPARRPASNATGSVSRTSLTPAPGGTAWPRRRSCPRYRSLGAVLDSLIPGSSRPGDDFGPVRPTGSVARRRYTTRTTQRKGGRYPMKRYRRLLASVGWLAAFLMAAGAGWKA